MDRNSATLFPMAKGKKPTSGRPKGRKPTEVVTARIAPDLAQAFNEHVESLRPKTSVTAMLTFLIENYLESKGLWPPTSTD